MAASMGVASSIVGSVAGPAVTTTSKVCSDVMFSLIRKTSVFSVVNVMNCSSKLYLGSSNPILIAE